MSRMKTNVRIKTKNQVPESVINGGECLGEGLAKPSVVLICKAQLFW